MLDSFKKAEVSKKQAAQLTGGIAAHLCPYLAADLAAAQAAGDTDKVAYIRQAMDDLGC